MDAGPTKKSVLPIHFFKWLAQKRRPGDAEYEEFDQESYINAVKRRCPG